MKVTSTLTKLAYVAVLLVSLRSDAGQLPVALEIRSLP
jgi:hypothetical protein